MIPETMYGRFWAWCSLHPFWGVAFKHTASGKWEHVDAAPDDVVEFLRPRIDGTTLHTKCGTFAHYKGITEDHRFNRRLYKLGHLYAVVAFVAGYRIGVKWDHFTYWYTFSPKEGWKAVQADSAEVKTAVDQAYLKIIVKALSA